MNQRDISKRDTSKRDRRNRLRGRVLAGVSFSAFVITGCIIAPASLVKPALSASGADIAYQEIRGTIWRGEARGVSLGEAYLGNITFKLRPLALIAGAASADISAHGGAATGSGRVSVNPITRRLQLEDANFAFDLSSVRRYSLFGIPYQGRIEAQNATIIWTRTGCVAASGKVWTDVLDASSKSLVGESLLLAGPAACESGRVLVKLGGGNRQGDAEIKIAIDPSMTYRIMASVNISRADLENNLRRLGFEDGDGGLVYDAVGALKGAGS